LQACETTDELGILPCRRRRHYNHGAFSDEIGQAALVHLYRFDEVDAALDLLPMAARRALDHAGKKVSLGDWKQQPITWRQQLVILGSDSSVDASSVLQLLEHGRVPTTSIEACGDPVPTVIPDAVRVAFGASRPIPEATWSALSALDRYALVKVSVKARPERLDRAHQEIIGQSAVSNHLEPGGGVRMVNVGEKPISKRTATAETWVKLSPDALERLVKGDGPKGDVFGVARIAAIQAAKKTSDLIPLCHTLALTKVSVEFDVDREASKLRIAVNVQANDRTGVEMEALTAVSISALTVYDMLKSVDRAMVIGPTQLLEKQGGRTGDYSRGSAP
jgi:cyclic pyranopterin phosphate synthase